MAREMSREEKLIRSLRDSVADQWTSAVARLEDHLKSSKDTNTRVNDTLNWARDVQRCADQLVILDRLILRLLCDEHNNA